LSKVAVSEEPFNSIIGYWLTLKHNLLVIEVFPVPGAPKKIALLSFPVLGSISPREGLIKTSFSHLKNLLVSKS
jgi:hypothetical protein